MCNPVVLTDTIVGFIFIIHLFGPFPMDGREAYTRNPVFLCCFNQIKPRRTPKNRRTVNQQPLELRPTLFFRSPKPVTRGDFRPSAQPVSCRVLASVDRLSAIVPSNAHLTSIVSSPTHIFTFRFHLQTTFVSVSFLAPFHFVRAFVARVKLVGN